MSPMFFTFVKCLLENLKLHVQLAFLLDSVGLENHFYPMPCCLCGSFWYPKWLFWKHIQALKIQEWQKTGSFRCHGEHRFLCCQDTWRGMASYNWPVWCEPSWVPAMGPAYLLRDDWWGRGARRPLRVHMACMFIWGACGCRGDYRVLLYHPGKATGLLPIHCSTEGLSTLDIQKLFFSSQ